MTELENRNLSIWEQDALALSQAALQIDQSRSQPVELAAALNCNLELWIAIKTLASSDTTSLPQPIRNNLTQLYHYVAETTLRHGTAMRTQEIDSLVNINLQISEGLLEGHARVAEPATA